MLTFQPLAGRVVNIDYDALPQQSKDFVINYGLKQLLADSHVAGKTPDEKAGLLDKKLDKLLEGTLDIRTSTRGGDPVARELTKLATLRTEAHFKKLGHKIKDVAKADHAAIMAKFRAHPKLVELAKANVEASDAIEL